MQKENEILKEYIRLEIRNQLLKEQMDLTDDVLYQAFIQPFVDVFQTARHGLESVAATTFSNIKTLGKAIGFTMLPFLAPNAGSILKMNQQDKQQLKQKLDGINSKFSDVLARNWQTLMSSDLQGTFFMLAPSIALGQKLIAKSPAVSLSLISSLLGNNEKVNNLIQRYNSFKTGGQEIQRQKISTNYADQGIYAGDELDYGLLEQQQQPVVQPNPQTQSSIPTPQQQKQKINPEQWLQQQLQQLLKDPNIANQIDNSPAVKAMQQQLINNIVQDAQTNLNFDWNGLKAKLGDNINKALSQLKDPKTKKALTVQEIDKNPNLQKEIIKQAKQQLLPGYIKQLNVIATKSPEYKKLIQQAIQQIQKLIK